MDHRGISAVAQAVTLVLERSWRPDLIDGVTPQFKCYRSRDFADPMPTGLSVFVHLATDAPQPGRVPAPDRRNRPGVSVQVHFLLTAWAESAPAEQALLGWAACVLAEHPVLDASLLNEVVPGVCGTGETIQVRADSDPAVTVTQLWQVLPCPIQLSLPYVTSAVHLGSQ